jgi:hypothetical protein
MNFFALAGGHNVLLHLTHVGSRVSWILVAADIKYCGKEIKRKLEQGPVDHDLDFKCKVYENGRVAGNPETLRQLEGFSEREIANGTGLHRKPIRLFKHGGTVTRRTYQRIMNFLKAQTEGPT